MQQIIKIKVQIDRATWLAIRHGNDIVCVRMNRRTHKQKHPYTLEFRADMTSGAHESGQKNKARYMNLQVGCLACVSVSLK